MFSLKKLSSLVFALSLLVTCLCRLQAQEFPETHFTKEEVQCSNPANEEECYFETFCKIVNFNPSKNSKANETYMEFCNRNYKGSTYRISRNGYSTYNLYDEKPNTIIVTFHGLWGDSRQFNDTIGGLTGGYQNKFNIINVTLPGHIKTEGTQEYFDSIKKHPPFSHYQEWIKALKQNLEVANLLGDNVIVIGQSTGGLLATYAAVQFPELVDQVILVEPALKVNKLKNWGSCVGARLIPRALLKLAGSVIGVNLPDGVSVKMGCEVQKLADELFRYSENDDQMNYEAIARQIKTPVLMFNNVNDKIVSAKVNDVFFNALEVENKRYIPFNFNKKIEHGEITSDPDDILSINISQFYFEEWPESPIGEVFVSKVKRALRYKIKLDCLDEGKSINNCKSFYKVWGNDFEKTDDLTCRYFDSTEICKMASVSLQKIKEFSEDKIDYYSGKNFSVNPKRVNEPAPSVESVKVYRDYLLNLLEVINSQYPAIY